MCLGNSKDGQICGFPRTSSPSHQCASRQISKTAPFGVAAPPCLSSSPRLQLFPPLTGPLLATSMLPGCAQHCCVGWSQWGISLFYFYFNFLWPCLAGMPPSSVNGVLLRSVPLPVSIACSKLQCEAGGPRYAPAVSPLPLPFLIKIRSPPTFFRSPGFLF